MLHQRRRAVEDWPQAHFRGGLFIKYATVLVALVSVVLLTSGLFQAYAAYQQNQAATARLHEQQAIGTAGRIDEFFSKIIGHVTWASRVPDGTAPDLADQRLSRFKELLSLAQEVSEIRYVDATGHEQLVVSRTGPTAAGSGRDFFGDPRFVHAQAGMATFSEVSFRNGSAPFVSLTSPRMSGGGVTIAELDLRFVGEVLDAANQTIGGDAYVVDDHGQLIAHADLARVLRHTDLKPLHQVQEALAAQALGTDSKRHTSVSRNAGGEPVLSSFQTMPRTGWSVFVEQPLDEAFAPAYESLRRTAYLLALGLIVSILISLALARGMVAPIWRLRIAAARIGDGAFDQRIEVHTGDELEALAGEFNRMSQRLQESHNTLEQRVEERTHDLAAAKATIEAQATQLTDWNRTLEARVVEEVDKNERLDRLRRFLTPQLADIVVEEDERALESHRRDITVVFTDLRGFTEFAEQAEPEEVMRVLHEYHEVMGELVFRYEGTLERFAGDGLMVFFNDPLPCPDPAQRAVRMALEMRERVRLLEQSWQRRGYQLGFGVGIAMGYATLGKIGFEGRYDYGAIGSVTNLASRLCDEAASGQILIGQRVFGEVEDLVEIEPLSPLALKGFSRPVPAYNVLALARVPELEPAALPTA